MNELLRTDLALEEKESFEGDGGEISGVKLTENEKDDINGRVTVVDIFNKKGAKSMNKPVGKYITLESDYMGVDDSEYIEKLQKELADIIGELIGNMKKGISVLVVGLGNRDVTSDSLGPRTTEKVHITRHLEESESNVSGIIPGVMAFTGIESAQIVKGVIDEIKPNLVIAIDALAARSVLRLGKTIQLTNTGIQPGSGVGNHRNSLTEASLGVPVIAIGVPTVVTAAALVYDTSEAFIEALKSSAYSSTIGESVEKLSNAQRYELIRDIIEPKLGPMFVTPKDIDEKIRVLSEIVSGGINIALA
ncbi:MAG: GPR endopeptidase [Lachnospiraceae bacterium]|nr:GPR endopeptidase [Lachnospiraceae bacterium]